MEREAILSDADTIFETSPDAAPIDEAAEKAPHGDLRVGDKVWIPAALVSAGDSLFAWLHRKIVSLEKGMMTVDGQTLPAFQAGRARKELGVLLLTLGDFASEYPTLDPLTKSALHFLRLLLPDEALKAYKVRTFAEIKHIWDRDSANISHIVLVGHADENGIVMGAEKEDLSAAKLIEMLDLTKDQPSRIFVCLACRTGTSSFAKELSAAPAVECVIAPFRSVHAGVASLFVQTFFTCHFLRASSPVVAFSQTLKNEDVGKVRYRLWKAGQLVKSATGGQGGERARAADPELEAANADDDDEIVEHYSGAGEKLSNPK